ncbi:hypothetical protein OIU85_007672 [Salix viminalis]|uniref:Exocyst subunit Exo70 family protein n=1 Tax=Salix viminalis TaxID=40686 RepID=A0A9Q0PA29_SALVM|nr:hypothetical protein OIU85_007672 [Salix viminalis]
MALQFRAFCCILEFQLHNKAKLFKDASLKHVFLMNNIHYMVQKVENSELQFILGEEWIREHNWEFQQHVMNYKSITWSPVLSLLKDEGNPNSNAVSKTHVEKKFRSFYHGFEKVCRAQTACSIPDDQLREDLRNSISLKVNHAYQKFVERHTDHVSDKRIEYISDHLQNCLLQLFKGSQIKIIAQPC